MTRKLDIVLVNPANLRQIYQSLSNTMSAIEPPVWAGLMATFVRNKGYSVAIIDAAAENLSPAEVARRVLEMDPVLTAIVVYGQQPSASTQVMPGAGAVARAIKELEPNRKVLLLGGHVAALPERSLREEAADFVASGEGLFTMVELIEAIKANSDEFHKVPDLWSLKANELRVGPPAPLLRELDKEMSGIAWDLLPMHLYRAHNWHCFETLDRQPYAAMYTTLGCPYHCSFCCIQAPFKSGESVVGMANHVNSYRFWSPDQVLREIDTLVTQYGVRNIKFADEMFVLNRRHVNAICDKIIERGYDLNIWAYTRVDTIKDDMTEKLKGAGIDWLAFGIEAASERVRDDVQKGVKQDEIFQVIEHVRSHGLYVIGNFIFGLPEDDHDTMKETLDMAIDLNCEFANFYSAMAYPGSELYAEAIENNWQLPDSWSGYSQHAVDTLPLPTKYLTSSEVLRFRDSAFQTYFTGAKYLDMIRQRFGEATVQHIREMTNHRLERQNA